MDNARILEWLKECKRDVITSNSVYNDSFEYDNGDVHRVLVCEHYGEGEVAIMYHECDYSQETLDYYDNEFDCVESSNYFKLEKSDFLKRNLTELVSMVNSMIFYAYVIS